MSVPAVIRCRRQAFGYRAHLVHSAQDRTLLTSLPFSRRTDAIDAANQIRVSAAAHRTISVLQEASSGLWRLMLHGRNGVPIATGGPFADRASLVEAIDLIRRIAPLAQVA